MSRPIGEIRATLPREIQQVYAGDLAAARQLGGRAVQVGVPGGARAARAENQRQLAEPPGVWKRFLNFIGWRKFTPEESDRAQTHALSKQLKDAVMRLSTGHASKDALLGQMQDITKSIQKLALTVVSRDKDVQDLFAGKARLGQEIVAMQARLAKASGDDALKVQADIDAGTQKLSKMQNQIDSTVARKVRRVEDAIVETRMATLVGQLGDGALRQLRDAAEQTYQRFQSQVPNTDPESPELQALPEGPAKNIEYALRRRKIKSLVQPMGLAQAVFVTTGKELKTRGLDDANPAPAPSPAVPERSAAPSERSVAASNAPAALRLADLNYEYRDQDMSALGTLYQEQLGALRQIDARRQHGSAAMTDTHFLAPISNLEGRVLSETLADAVQAQQEKGAQPFQIAIPYNLGNAHWTGILVGIDPGAPPHERVKVQYMDSLNPRAAIPEHARQQITQALAPFFADSLKFETVEPHYVQHDVTSCGPCTMANLFQQASGLGAPPSEARADMRALRQQQIALLASA